MSEETVTPSGQADAPAPGSTPAPEAPAPEPTGQEEAKTEYLTRAEAKALEDRILNQSRSYADKGRVRVEKAVQDVTQAVATMRTLGQTVTPEQEKALKDEATRKAMTEPEPAPAGEQPPQQTQQIDPEIVAIEKETGVQLLDGDPELSLLVRDQGPRKWYQSVEAAHNAKKTRLASTTKTETHPAARVPVLGTPPSGLPERATAHDAWERVRHNK